MVEQTAMLMKPTIFGVAQDARSPDAVPDGFACGSARTHGALSPS
jgi:hypothetical protein